MATVVAEPEVKLWGQEGEIKRKDVIAHLRRTLSVVLPYWLSDRKFLPEDSRQAPTSANLQHESELKVLWKQINQFNHEAWSRKSYAQLQREQDAERRRLRQVEARLREVAPQIRRIPFGSWPPVCRENVELLVEYLILRDRCLLRRKIFRYKWDRRVWYTYQDTNTSEVMLEGLLSVLRGTGTRE